MSRPERVPRAALLLAWAALLACGGPRPAGAPAPATIPVVEDDIFVGEDGEDARDPTTVQDDENDPEIEIGAEPEEFTDPVPTEDGGEDDPALAPPTDSTVTIRVATFNAFLSGVAKSRRPLPDSVIAALGAAAGGTIGQFPFLLMVDDTVHALAVQEVMLNRVRIASDTDPVVTTIELAEHHPTLNDGGGGRFRVIRGEPVQMYTFSFRNGPRRIRVTRCEYCPIIYDATVLACDSAGRIPIEPFAASVEVTTGDTTRMSRHANRADCRLVADTTQKFTFFCAHFAAGVDANRVNVGMVGALLGAAPNVMIGADFNSNAEITEAGFAAAWVAGLAGAGVYVRPAGDFTKVSRRDGLIQYRSRSFWRFLDDVLWNRPLDPPDLPANVGKTVTTFGRSLTMHNVWYQEYYIVSDHFPVLADFAFALTL
jgi:hypothetical protein